MVLFGLCSSSERRCSARSTLKNRLLTELS